jgi:protein phosphatase
MEGHPGKSDGHQLHTTSEQEIMTEQRQDVPMLPCGPAKQGRQVRLFHASQQSVYYRVRMDDPREKLLEMFANTEFTGNTCVPDVVGYGDIHRAYVMNFHQQMLFNVGSVGNPLDMTQASYAVVEGTYDSQRADTFAVHLIRVPYDIELAIQQAAEEHMPELEPYANELRTALYRGTAPGS